MIKVISFFLIIGSFFLLIPQETLAASTTMEFSPQSGSFDKSFNVNLIIDGHGDKFNAAQATVKIPSNLAIKDLIWGDCNFSFLKTPSIQQPSFAGVILSKYSTKCTVYTLFLVPVAKGDASISLSKTSVKRFGDAASILSSIKEGKYSLTAALKSPSVLGISDKNESQSLYTLNLKITTTGNNPVTDAIVVLNAVANKNQIKKKVNSQGLAIFNDIKEGIYSASVERDGNKLGETIINVSGSNHTLTLSINIDAPKNNPLMKNSNSFFIIGILILGIIIGISFVLFLMKIINKKSNNKTSI